MEQIGQTVLEVGERVKRAVEERYAAMPDCRDHDGHKQHDCPLCKADESTRRQAEWEAYRERSRLDAIVKAEESFAGFPARFAGAQADHAAVVEWAAGFGGDNPHQQGLLLLGPTGVGKTWQAYGALRAACMHPTTTRITSSYRPRYWKAAPFADLLAQLRPRPKGDAEAVMEELKAIDLLLIDDLAASKGSEWVEEQTYRLINGRYEAMLPTIFTTNLALPELRETIGDRIASRLAESCTRVVLQGSDRRRAKRVEPAP